MAVDRDTVTVPALLKYNEEQFSTAMSNMAPANLMNTISGLQQEMRSEQENFNSLGQQLDGLKDKRSQQFKQISKDLMASQSRLTLLMNRSMTCFSQQSSKSQTQTLDRRNHANRADKLRANSDANILSSSLSAYNQEPRERSSSFTRQTNSQPQSNQHSVNIAALSKNFNNGPSMGVTSATVNNNIPQKPSEQSKAISNHVSSNHVQSSSSTRDSDSAKTSKTSSVQRNQNLIPESNPVKVNGQSESFSATKPSAKSVSNTVTISNNPPQKSEEKKIVYKIPQVSALRQAFEVGKVDPKTVNVKIPNGLSHNAAIGIKNGSNSNSGTSSASTVDLVQNGSKSKSVAPSSGAVNVLQNGTRVKSVSQNIFTQKDSKSNSELKTSKIELDSSFNPRKYVQFEDPAETDRRKLVKSLEANTVQSSQPVSDDNVSSSVSNSQPKVLLPRKSSLKKRKNEQPTVVVQASNISHGPKANSTSDTVNSSRNRIEQKTKPVQVSQMLNDTVDSVTVKQSSAGKDSVPVTSIDDIVIEERSENGPVDKTSQKLNISSVESKSVDLLKDATHPIDSNAPDATGLLSSRLQRIRSGPQVTRNRPETLQSSGRASLGGAGVTGFTSILENRPSQRILAAESRNPFQARASQGYQTLPSSYRSRESTSSRFMPSAPQFEEVRLSSDLLKVRELLKGKGYAGVPSEAFARSQTTSSRRESLMQRQPAAAASLHTFTEEPMSAPSPSIGFFSSSSSNGVMNGTDYRETRSLVSPVSILEESSTGYLSPTFSNSDSTDMLEKRQEIESKFQELGSTIDSQTSSALDRITRARKFLEESKKASEARISKFQSRAKTPNSELSSMSNGDIDEYTETERTVTPSDSYASRFSRSSSVLSNEGGSSLYQRESFTSPVSDLQDRPDIPSAFSSRTIGNETVLNHSESSHFQPIETDYSARIREILGRAKQQTVSPLDHQEELPSHHSMSRSSPPTLYRSRSSPPTTFSPPPRSSPPPSQKVRPQSPPMMAHTLPRQSKATREAKPVKQVDSAPSKDTTATKTVRKTSGFDKPTLSTAAKAAPDTKPKPAKNPNKKTVKKLPQIAMFENMGQQNKTESKPNFRKNSRTKPNDITMQKMLFGKNSDNGESVDVSDGTSEDARSLDSVEIANIRQAASNVVKNGSPKSGRGSKSGSASPQSKTRKPDRNSPHSKSNRTERSSRSSSSDKSSQFSPKVRRKSIASPTKSHSRKSSPDRSSSRSRRNSTSDQSPAPSLSRRNSIRCKDNIRVQDKVTLSSLNKMNDKAKSKSKPDLRDLSNSREKSPKNAFRRSKSVSKDADQIPQNDHKKSPERKKSVPASSSTPQEVKDSNTPRSQINSGRKTPNASDSRATIDRLRSQGPKTKSNERSIPVSRSSDSQEIDSPPQEQPVGGWESIYVGPKERKLEDVKRLVDISREQRGVEFVEEEDPDTIPVGPGAIRTVLDRFKKNENGSSAGVNGNSEEYNTSVMQRVAQIKQRVLGTQESGEGEVSEMGGAPIYHPSAFRLELGEIIDPSKEASVADEFHTARSLDSESTDYDSAIEAQSATTQSLLSTEEDSTSEYNSAAETLGTDSDFEREQFHSDVRKVTSQKEEVVNSSQDYYSTNELVVNVDIDEGEMLSDALTPKANLSAEQNDLINFDDNVLVGPCTPLPVRSDVDDLFFGFDSALVQTPTLFSSVSQGALPNSSNESTVTGRSLVSVDGDNVDLIPQMFSESHLAEDNDIPQLVNVDTEIHTENSDAEVVDNLGYGFDEEEVIEQDVTLCAESVEFLNGCVDMRKYLYPQGQACNSEINKVMSDSEEVEKREELTEGSIVLNNNFSELVEILDNENDIDSQIELAPKPFEQVETKSDNLSQDMDLSSMLQDNDQVFVNDDALPLKVPNNKNRQSLASGASESSLHSVNTDDSFEECRLQSESDIAGSSDVKETIGESSSAASASQGTQAPGKKKRHRSESRKRRKRKHIEKAAALRESTGNSQSEGGSEISSSQLKGSDSDKKCGRKSKGALLMTNLLVLDMGLSGSSTEIEHGEPGAVFLPMKQNRSASEESLCDEAGSVADDESEEDTFEQSNSFSFSTDTDDQRFFTPEATSPELELPQPGFVRNNPFILKDGLSNLTEKDSHSNEALRSKNSDMTICDMFKRTLSILSTKYKENSSDEENASQVICRDSSEYSHVPPQSQISRQELSPFMPDRSSNSEGHQSHLETPCDTFSESDGEILQGDEALLSPKLNRGRGQSFIFHNKFIQEDLKAANKSHEKVLGRRRHRSQCPRNSAKVVQHHQRACSEDNVDSYVIIDSRECSPSRSISPSKQSQVQRKKQKPKVNMRFVQDNPFFKGDANHVYKSKQDLYYSNDDFQKDENQKAKKSSQDGVSLGNFLKAGFRKLTQKKSFRKSKSKVSTSSQDLSYSSKNSAKESQSETLQSNFGRSTPCLFDSNVITNSGDEQSDMKKSENPEDEDVVKSRVHLKSWNPIKLLETLYAVQLMDETVEDLSHRFISMEGIMEKLPQGKRKSTLLKTWKRRYFKATDGWLHYFENNNYDKPSHSIQLMGGSIEVLDSRIIGIDDGRGHYLMVRCPNATDFENWRVALESQTTDNAKAVFVRPVLHSPQHPNKRVVIIDIGSTSVRAGVLGEQASLPQLFFPTVVAKNKTTGECVVGFDAYKPEVRDQSILHFPVRPSIKVNKGKSNPFNIDMEFMPFIFDKIFKDLKIDSKSHWVLLSTPQMLADKLKAEIMHTLTRRYGVAGVCIAPQSLLAMYSYKATSGIIVDIGERIEILPISDGYIVDGGVTRQPFGGEKVMDSLNRSLTQHQYHLYTEVEHLIVRHAMEKTCYIAGDYNEETKKFTSNPKSFKASVDLSKYKLPAGTYREVTHDDSCFKSAEGFFNTDLWGLDYPKLHKLVHKAIQECPMDNRREMCRSIYLSGGVTLLPGFAERLQAELTKLVPQGLTVQVHVSPHRYHAAYIGGCTLAAQDLFEQTCITREQWNKNGTAELKKWHMPS